MSPHQDPPQSCTSRDWNNLFSRTIWIWEQWRSPIYRGHPTVLRHVQLRWALHAVCRRPRDSIRQNAGVWPCMRLPHAQFLQFHGVKFWDSSAVWLLGMDCMEAFSSSYRDGLGSMCTTIQGKKRVILVIKWREMRLVCRTRRDAKRACWDAKPHINRSTAALIRVGPTHRIQQ